MNEANNIVAILFWSFILLALISPWFRQKNLESARLSLIHKIEKKRKSQVIALIHRQETMALLGFPIIKYINIEDSEAILRAIRLTPKKIPKSHQNE